MSEQQPLKACKASPNCVCSEYEDDIKHYVEPLTIPNSIATNKAIAALKKVIEENGGVVTASSEYSLKATYTTQWLKFVDDVDARIDPEKRVIHIRSASRVGYYDFEVNKERVQRLRKLFV